MIKRFFPLFLLGLYFATGINGQGVVAQTAVSPDPIITVQTEQILFSWQLPAPEISVVDGKTAVSMFGLEQVQGVGLPQLPTKSFLLALPVGAQPELIVANVVEEIRPYAAPLTIAPQPAGAEFDENGFPIGGEYIEAVPQPFAKPIATLEEIGQMRGVRMARLNIYPVRPDGNLLKIAQSVQLSIQLSTPQSVNRLAAATELDEFTQMVSNIVINPTQVEQQIAPTSLLRTQSVAVSVDTAVIEINKVGITAVSYSDLANIGFPVGSVNPQKLHLTRDGVEIAFEWVGDGDAQFESNEKFLFYASPWFNRWMNEDVYFLSATSANGLRVANVPTGGSGGQQQFEENKIYTPDCICAPLPAGRDGDRWVWDDLRKPGRPSNTYPLPLSNVKGEVSAQITIWMIGFTAVADVNPDHKVDVSLNGTNLGNITWDGKTAVTQTLTIPANTLQNNNNLQLSLTGNTAIDGVWLDALQIAYTPLTPPTNPVYSPASLRMVTPLAGATGADYILVAPQLFMGKVGSLVALRQSQGMQVVTEDVQAIYDAFGYGRSTPEAIQRYLQYAYQNWSPTPEFVLLVGDGTSDPKQYKSDSKSTWIPPYLVDVDPWIGEIAADNRFVTVDGDDILPDMALGRLPVNTVAEVEIVIDKIVQYETTPFFGDWNSKLLSVTDDTDAAGNFAQHSDALLNTYINDPWTATKNYYNPAVNASEAEKNSLITRVQTAVLSKWNQGTGMVMFTGHSSIHQWAGERIFHLDDVADLNNGQRLPVVLQMTCFTSAFQNPYWDTMDEGLIRRENGGAVATWGPTGLGVATGHDALANGFLNTITEQGIPQLGRAAVAGKIRVMAEAPAHVDLIDTFTLLGDPATRYDFDFWPGYDTYLPITTK